MLLNMANGGSGTYYVDSDSVTRMSLFDLSPQLWLSHKLKITRIPRT